MFFGVHFDQGSEIQGFLVPDSMTEQPIIAIETEGKELGRFKTVELMPEILGHRHETALCAFRIGPDDVPALESYADIAIRDVASSLVIFRRLQPHHIAQRVLYLEMSIIPTGGPLKRFYPDFQYFA
ncbi:MAG: hypothetical protein AAF737_02985, partial [Pseudomonadota bacterium]